MNIVFHNKSPNFDSDKPGNFPKDFEAVAIVSNPDLEVTFMLTNHIDEAWMENAGVTSLVEADRLQPRSTSVGDMVLCLDEGEANGELWLCMTAGWSFVRFVEPKEIPALLNGFPLVLAD